MRFLTRRADPLDPTGPAGSSTDERWMRLALRAARAAESRGEVPVGAVAVLGDRLLGRGANRTVSACDPSAHAEIVALRRAARRAGNHRLAGVTLYVTLEPCSMCLGAAVQARIERLVYGAADPKGGGTWLLGRPEHAARTNHRIDVEGGVLAAEAATLLKRFFSAKRQK